MRNEHMGTNCTQVRGLEEASGGKGRGHVFQAKGMVCS